MEAYFLDSYALIEIALGNPNYKKFKENCRGATSIFNLMEVYYSLLKTIGISNAKKYYHAFKKYCIDLSDEIIMDACEFKYYNRNLNLSYVDCLGYVLALKTGIKFLTGDKEFKGMDNVEFVK